VQNKSVYFKNNITTGIGTAVRILTVPASGQLRLLLMFVGPCIIVQFIKKNQTRWNNVSKFYYSILIWSSACFGRHTAHHQEPKTALAASGTFVCFQAQYVTDNVHQLHVQQPSTYEKPEAASAVLGSWWLAVFHPKHVKLHINME
jgi:disulfide bond formation protein DsbB